MSFKKGGQILLAKLHSATRKSTVIFSPAYVRRRNRGWNLLCRYEENFLPADLVLSKFTWDMDYQCRLLFEDLKSACKNIKKKKKVKSSGYLVQQSTACSSNDYFIKCCPFLSCCYLGEHSDLQSPSHSFLWLFFLLPAVLSTYYTWLCFSNNSS